MKLKCEACAGLGEVVAEKNENGKKTGVYLAANEHNLVNHCRGGGDLSICDVCEGDKFIVNHTQAARYVMKVTKDAMNLVKDMGSICAAEFYRRTPELRVRAEVIADQFNSAVEAIRTEEGL